MQPPSPCGGTRSRRGLSPGSWRSNSGKANWGRASLPRGLNGGCRVIRGVLLDVGDTLTTPIGGRWNPRFDFEDNLARFGFALDSDRLTQAFVAGDEYLNRMNSLGNRDEYHRVILGELDIEAS